jgi:hypothetical protein
MLLERLGRSMHELALPFDQRLAILCSAAARIWRPAPGCGLPTGTDKGRRLIEFITTTREDLDRPCSERAIDYAQDCAERRIAAHDDQRAVLIHGDVHQWNAVQAEQGFTLVDPEVCSLRPSTTWASRCARTPRPPPRRPVRTCPVAGGAYRLGGYRHLGVGLVSSEYRPGCS